MKIITILLVTVILNACGNAKTAANRSIEEVKMELSQTTQETIKIDYRSHARGNFKQIILDNKKLSVQTGYDAKPIVKPCSDKDWDAIIALIEDNKNLIVLTELEAPSKAHQYDGAPMVNFTITKGNTVYELKPFDGGNPHKDAAELVNKVIYIANKSKE